MSSKFQTWDEVQLKRLADPESARLYLEVAIEEYQEDNDKAAFLQAIRRVADAKGGISNLAKETGLNRQHLYKALSPNGNPRLETIGRVLNGMGFQLTVSHRNAS